MMQTPPKELCGIPVRCAYREQRDIVSLVPHPRNFNKHPDRQIALLSRIVRETGWRAPIVISARSGFVVAGHGRLEAAKLLQVETVPVDVQEFETEAAEIAHLAADNTIAELAEPDAAGFAAIVADLTAAGVDAALAGVIGEIEAEVPKVKESGLGNPVVHYDLIFDDEEQQTKWFAFIRALKAAYADKETIAERVIAFIEANPLSQENQEV